MITQSRQIRDKCYRGFKMRTFICSVTLMLLGVVISPVFASSTSWEGITGNEGRITTGDTVKTRTRTFLDTRESTGLSRPRFETVHLVLGIGMMFSEFSDLRRLGVEKSNFSLPVSIYVYIPFQKEEPSFYFTGGWDFSKNSSFKALFLYQTRFKIILGLGGGKTFYSDDKDDLIVESSQNHGLVAFGVNLSPQRVDLLLTAPIGRSISTDFEGTEYSIRPAGIQFNLLISLR